MTDYISMERQLSSWLALDRRPVAVAFRDTAPPGIEPFAGSEPSSCSYWRLAAEGRTFYTVAGDHYNCPIGSYTHHIPMPDDRTQELDQVLGYMTDLGYVRMEEVSAIPRWPSIPGVIVYAPLAETPVDPDIVLFSGRPGRLMLLQEAALRARVVSELNTLSRPTCMALSAALATGMVASTACIGNRVYTDIDDGDFYVAVRGTELPRIVAESDTIVRANAALLQYHRDRRLTLTRV